MKTMLIALMLGLVYANIGHFLGGWWWAMWREAGNGRSLRYRLSFPLGAVEENEDDKRVKGPAANLERGAYCFTMSLLWPLKVVYGCLAGFVLVTVRVYKLAISPAEWALAKALRG